MLVTTRRKQEQQHNKNQIIPRYKFNNTANRQPTSQPYTHTSSFVATKRFVGASPPWRAKVTALGAFTEEMVLELSVFMLVVFVANASEGMPLLLKPCIKGAENQTYAVVVVPPYVSPAAVKSGKGFCLDIVGVPAGKARAGNSVEATPCGRNQMNLRANQYWAVKTNNLVSLQVMDTPYCFGITETRAGMLTNCSSSDADFTVGFKGKNAGTLIHTETGLCVTASGIPPPMPGPPPPRPPSPPNTPCSTPAPAPPSAFPQIPMQSRVLVVAS